LFEHPGVMHSGVVHGPIVGVGVVGGFEWVGGSRRFVMWAGRRIVFGFL